jgi:hypothetical protein
MTQKQLNILSEIRADVRHCSKLTQNIIDTLEAYLKKSKKIDDSAKTKSSKDI